MKKQLTLLRTLISGALVLGLYTGCRDLHEQNEQLIRPWTGLFFEDRNTRSLGLQGPVAGMEQTDYAAILYDSAGLLMTDTSALQGDQINRSWYTFDRYGRITGSTEYGTDYRSVHYEKHSDDIRRLFISSGDDPEPGEKGELSVYELQLKYSRKRLTGLQGVLRPFDLEDFFRDISLRTTYTYTGGRDSSRCTEVGALCITVDRTAMVPDDSLKLEHQGFQGIPGTDTFRLPYQVIYIRNRQGLLTSKTSIVSNDFYDLIEAGTETITYSSHGKPLKRILTGAHEDVYMYDAEGREVSHRWSINKDYTEETRTVYDQRGRKMQEVTLSYDKEKFRYSKILHYQYDDRDSLTAIWQSAVMPGIENKGGEVPLHVQDPGYTQYGYDQKGLLAVVTSYDQHHALSEQVSYIHDRNGRLLRETKLLFGDGAKLDRVVTREYLYDHYGNRIREYEYDNDRLTRMKCRRINYYL